MLSINKSLIELRRVSTTPNATPPPACAACAGRGIEQAADRVLDPRAPVDQRVAVLDQRAVLADRQLGDVMASNTQLSWDQAKRYVYNELNAGADAVLCVYGGGQAVLVGPPARRKPESAAKFSVEHTWPRRAIWGGIGVDNMPESDLHHLYPTHQSLNSSRRRALLRGARLANPYSATQRRWHTGGRRGCRRGNRVSPRAGCRR